MTGFFVVAMLCFGVIFNYQHKRRHDDYRKNWSL